MPSLSEASRRYSLPESWGSLSPTSRALRETLRLISLVWKTSRTASTRSCEFAFIRMFSPLHSMAAPSVCQVGGPSVLRGLFGALCRGASRPGWTNPVVELLSFHPHLGRLPERPMGVDCKSIAKASKVRILHLPPRAREASDLRKRWLGAFRVVRL